MIPHLYRLLLRQQVTKGRLVLVAGFAAMVLLIAFAMARSIDDDVIEPVVGFLSVVALGLLVPILCLVFGSSSLGQPVEDENLVYLWLRPYPRWQLAVAAFLAAVTVTVPAVVVPSTVAALVGTRGDWPTGLAVAAATALAAVGYTGLFTLFGLLLRRALEIGLVYIFIWELFVARAGAGAARLSLNTYPGSVLARMTDIELPQADRGMVAAVVVPLAVVAVALVLTSWRLDRTDVA